MTFGQHSRPFLVGLSNKAKLLTIFLNDGLNHIKRHAGKIEAMSCGFMLGSSALMPIICTQTSELGKYLKPALGLFVVSTGCYVGLNRKTITESAPIVLGFFPAAVVLIFLSPRHLLGELPPWVPLYLAMNILVSVSVNPWIKSAIRLGRAPNLRQLLQANNNDRAEGSQAGTIDPDSTKSSRASSGTSDRIRSTQFNSHPLDFAHLGHMETTEMNVVTNAEDDMSDIDLEEGLNRTFGSSHGSVGSQDHLI